MAAEHEALKVFIGDWAAEGSSYGGDEQSLDDPHGGATPWRSVTNCRWHSGEYFVVQDQRANGPFDTLALMGWDSDTSRYFVRSVENHGYARDYAMTVEGDSWRIDGDQERATITFSDDGRTQTHAWELKVDGVWLPLCDRVETRID